ncbi:hypothetical protein [Qipengyuania sp. JC766]|uniref:TonB-dependent receptor plug domain-containing protein n=1 Tax=Qipengyuania sp. JC766 TaxID=3232139 RepID=UPI00345751AC
MKTMPFLAGASMLALLSPSLAHAQDMAQADPPPSEQADPEVEEDVDPGEYEIVVTASRVRGQLNVEQAPVLELNEDDIAAFGAGSIEDLLAAIEPATGTTSGRGGGGRPVFLINGIRVSSFREFFRYPPEAIARLEVFPEEVAQRFGFPPTRRVVNIILKDDFSQITAEVEYEQPDRGGFSRNEQEVNYLDIGDGGARINVNLEASDTSLLTEAERGLVTIGAPGEEPFRSLIADSMQLEGTVNYARGFVENASNISLTAAGEYEQSTSLSGLRTGTLDPLERRRETDTQALGGSYNQPVGDFNFTATLDMNRVGSITEIDRESAAGFDTSRSETYTLDNKYTLGGTPIFLPAGDVSTTFDLGLNWQKIKGEDTRSSTSTSLVRRQFDGGVNVAVPLAERDGHWGAIGDLSINLAGGFEDISDFGLLADYSIGATWSPLDGLDLTATRVWRQSAPGLSALGAPVVTDFNVPVFDFTTGENALVDVISGGNPNLEAETQSDWLLGLNWELPFLDGARFQMNYTVNRSDDVTLSSPAFTSAFEDAFPDRVTRNAAGDLLAIDRRPVTLFETRGRSLSFGINARGQIGPAPADSEGRGGRGGRRGGMGGGQAATPPAEATGNQGSQQGAGRFDPQRMQAIRQTFCATPEDQVPDLSGIPEQFRARLLDENGNPDPQKIAEARERFCGEEAQQGLDRFAAIRGALCVDPVNIDALPPRVLERLRNENGEIDQERLAQLKARVCEGGGEQAASGSGEAGNRGQGRGGGSGAPSLPFGRGDRDPRPRYFISLNHSIQLESEVTLAENGPVFDQLDGQVIGGGAIPRHSARLEGGLFWQGYGFRLSGNYIGEATLQGFGTGGSSDLFFGDLATFDLRLFADLGEALKQEDGWLDGLRVSLGVDNIFDARRSVVDGNGITPDAYDPLRIDPTGRYLSAEIRKRF